MIIITTILLVIADSKKCIVAILFLDTFEVQKMQARKTLLLEIK